MLRLQQWKPNLPTQVVALHLPLAIPDRVIASIHLFGAECADQENPLLAGAGAKVTEKVHARWIGPMQVFEQKNHRSRGGECAQRISKFPKHAFLCGTNGFPVQLLEGTGRSEGGRELETPGGRMAAKHYHDKLATRTAQQSGESIEKR
jgi:hypothetical protein